MKKYTAEQNCIINIYQNGTVEEVKASLKNKEPALLPEGKSPLHFAVRNTRHPNVLQFLLDEGFDPNHKARHGIVPFHEALGAGNLQAIDILLQYGADPHKPLPYEVSITTLLRRTHNEHIENRVYALIAKYQHRDWHAETPPPEAMAYSKPEEEEHSLLTLFNSVTNHLTSFFSRPSPPMATTETIKQETPLLATPSKPKKE